MTARTAIVPWCDQIDDQKIRVVLNAATNDEERGMAQGTS
jgi:hypothetical protein